MKLPRRNFLHLAAGAAALPAVSRIAWAQAYPTRPVRIVVGYAPVARPTSRAPDGSMAVGTARPAIRRREPAGRRHQHRHRGRRAGDRRTATRSSWSSAANAINATLYDKLNFNFIRDIAPVAGIIRVPHVMVVQSIGFGQDRSRVHRLCQSQSGQAQHGFARHRDGRPCLRRAVQDDDWSSTWFTCPYRGGGACDDRPARRSGAGLRSAP